MKPTALTLLAAALPALASLSSCTESSPFYSDSRSSEEIYFAVNTAATRAEAARIPEGTLAMRSAAGDTLYLIGSESEGIDAGGRGSVSTRGAVVGNSGELGAFGVFASMGQEGESYMANVEVLPQSDCWAPEAEYLWPGEEPLHFNAYAPYASQASTEGITALPSQAGSAEPTLSYSVPASVTDQQDLMWADPIDASASPCNMDFNHALTAVSFVTGSEMMPCTVSEIRIEGVKDSGVLSLESGQWSDVDGSASYIVEPDKMLSAADGSQYAAPGESITASDQTFILMPQTLGEGTSVSVTVESDGTPTTFTASLAGQQWNAGTTVTYRLSVNPSSPFLFLQIVDSEGNVVESISSRYSGGEHSFTVRSVYDPGDGSDLQPVDWEATFLDASGNPVENTPEWIISFPFSGSGTTQCTMTTDLPDPIFEAMNEHTGRLRQAADINASSGHTPYNLASSTGAATVENTANCYLVGAPGTYSIPLVYGNAVKDGAANPGSYTSTLHSTTALKTFINHLGNDITDPYIYNNSGCVPASASLIWEGRLNLVRNVRLSDDGKNLLFDVPAASIRQGTALVGVSDKDGNVLWSWHIWVTDLKIDDLWVDVPAATGSAIYSLMAVNVGYLYGGDVTRFDPATVTARFTQKNVPAGLEPLTADFAVSQESATVTTPDCHTFYQWGRKDPLISSITWYYDADHNILPTASLPTLDFTTDYNAKIAASISHPDRVLTAVEGDLPKLSPAYTNLWNIDNASDGQAREVKCIYDPSPVGSKVPVGQVMQTLNGLTTTYDADTQSAVFTFSNGQTLSFPLLGYRTIGGVFVNASATEPITGVWEGHASGKKSQSSYLALTPTKIVLDSQWITAGFGVRPIRDE